MNTNNLKSNFPNFQKPSLPKEGYKTISIKSIDTTLSKKYESRYFALFRARDLENFKKRLGYIFENTNDPNYKNRLIDKNRKIDEISYALFAFCDLVISSCPAFRKDLDNYHGLNGVQKTDIFTRLLNTTPTIPKGKIVTVDQFVNLYISKSSGLYLGIDKADIAAAVVCNDFKDFQDLRLAILKKREATKENTNPPIEKTAKVKKPIKNNSQPKSDNYVSSVGSDEIEKKSPKSEPKEGFGIILRDSFILAVGLLVALYIKNYFNLDFGFAPDKQVSNITFAETNNRINNLINQPEVRKLLDKIKSETISINVGKHSGSGRMLGGFNSNKLPFAIESAVNLPFPATINSLLFYRFLTH